MGKSPNTCLNIITCGKRSKQNKSKNNIGTENQRKDSKGKQRWSFKKGTTQHRVLSTTVISEPTPLHLEQEGMGSTVHDQSKQTMATSIEKTTVSMLVDSTTVMPTTAVAASVTDAVNSHTDVDRSMEESAAITIQAAVRGYLARRELCALKSLVKLQAYVRGHLVRRQAVGSLRCVRAIVRLQALVRARRVRLSEQGMSIQEKLQQIRQQNSLKGSESESKSSSALECNSTFLSEKLSVNGFARQLLETAPKTGTLHIEYDPDKHNSGWKWLERWMSASPWESGLSMQPKNSSECQEKSESPQLPDIEAENCRHSLLSSTLDSVLDQPKAEAENSSFSSDNPKFSLRKTSNSTSDPVSDRPKVEFEKSVRSSRKVSNSTLVSVSDQLSRQLRMVSNSTLESVLDKHNVEAEAKKSVHSSGRVSYAKSDSVSNQPSMQWRKVANLASDSLLDQPKVETDNPQLSLRKISNSALDHILDQRKVEVEDTTCGLNNASNLKSGSVSDQLEAEAEKSILSLRKGSNSTMDFVSGRPTMLLRKESDSTLDSILSQEKDETENHQCNIRNVSNSTLDSVLEHPKIEAENHVCSMKKSLSDQLGVEDEKSMCASRKVSNSALDFIMNPSKVEVQNHQFSLATTSNSTLDSVADHPSLQLRNMSNLTSDSILDQPKVEVENTQLNLTKVPKLVLDSVSDQIKIENENPECSAKKASYSTFHSVSEQLEMTTESSKSTAKKSSYTAFESISDQLEAEAENFACNLIQVSNSTAGSVLDQPGNASNSTLDSVSDQLEVGVQKPMYSSREVSHSTLDSVLDQLKVEVENPKNSLEKKSNLVFDSVAVQLEAEPENLMDSFKKASNSTLNSTSDHPGQQINMENSLNTASNVLVQQAENDQSLSDQSPRRHETVPVVQGTSPIQLSTTGPPESTKRDDALAQQNCAIDTVPTKHERLESIIKTNLEHSATDLKAARRRTSFGSGKADNADNDSQGSPSVPHYMATTESAKAKSRAQRSTTSSPDLQDNNSAAKRRISLPDSHGKQNSGSPRTQRSLSQVLTTTKGNRVISPRDATEKKIQNEWRR